MTNEQLAADYSDPPRLSDVMLAAAITDEDIETYIKFSYTNGANVWRDVLAEAARRLTHKLRCASGISEVVRRDDVERRIWTHYDHARAKHPHFCDELTRWEQHAAMLLEYESRRNLATRTEIGDFGADDVLKCELAELMNAVLNGHTADAIEDAYDCIAVLLRVIDVLEGRQKLGKPEEGEIK